MTKNDGTVVITGGADVRLPDGVEVDDTSRAKF